MAVYAEKTTVSVEKSRSDIERLVTRRGASGFGYGWDTERECDAVWFRMDGVNVRYLFVRPDEETFSATPQGKQRSAQTMKTMKAQAERSLWRALYQLILGKFVAIDSGIRTFEDEFLPDMVLPDGRTVRQWASPQIRMLVERRQMPPLLPGVSEEQKR